MGAKGAHRAASGEPRAGFASVLRVRLFATLYLAETQSIVGDQLARVALSFLVFERTGSAPATAATYAATLLPGLIGGFLLGGLGDRYSRRLVMIGCDVVRAACFVTMAVPGMPLGVIIALVVLAVLLEPAFASAEVSLLSVRLSKDQFRAANGLRMISNQACQVAGFAFGGVVVALLDPRPALLLDAATFALSALLITGVDRWRGPRRAVPEGHVDTGPEGSVSAESVVVAAPEVSAAEVGAAEAGRLDVARVETAPEDRPTREAPPPTTPGPWAQLRRDPRRRALVGLTLVVGFFVVPQGLAVPFGAHAGASTVQVGLLLAASALGGAVGAAALVKLVAPHARHVVAPVMAVLCGLPLIVSGVIPTWPVALVCWFASGCFAAYVVETTTEVFASSPEEARSRLVGVVGALLLGAQGVGLLAFGAVATVVAPGTAIAVAAAVGCVVASALALGPLRTANHALLAAV